MSETKTTTTGGGAAILQAIRNMASHYHFVYINQE